MCRQGKVKNIKGREFTTCDAIEDLFSVLLHFLNKFLESLMHFKNEYTQIYVWMLLKRH